MITAFAVATACLIPQSPPPAGPFTEKPLVITGTSAGGGSNELLYAAPSPTPIQDFYPLVPHFAREQIFAPFSLPGVRFGSFSRGAGLLTIEVENDVPYHVVPGGGWSFFFFAVAEGTTGGAYDAEGDVRGDIWSYVVPGSETEFPPEFTGVVQKAREGSGLDVDDVSGIDTYLAGLLLGDDIPEDLGIYGPFFFTLTGALWQIPPEWGIGASSLDWQHPATIFRADYTASGWTQPTVHRTYEQLDLPKTGSSGQLTEVDALTVMIDGTILLSTAEPDLAQQLWLVGNFDEAGTPVAYEGPLFASAAKDLFVDTRLGLQTGGIVAICGDDPGPTEDPVMPRHEWRNQLMAFPDDTPGVERALGWAGHRRRYPYTATDFHEIRLWNHVPSGRYAALISPTMVLPLMTFQRNLANSVDMITAKVAVPASGSMIGMEVTYQWVVYGPRNPAVTHEFHFYVR